MRNQIDYGVVILNYNTAKDSILAAESIIKNAESHSFAICIVDNNSPKEKEIETLESACLEYCHILQINENRGYASGNNEGVKFLISHYDAKFIVIMNPDIIIKRKGTIDRLISNPKLQNSDYCGVQPLCWTPYLGDPLLQNHIRRVYSYSDVVIEHFFILKRLFRKKANKMVYYNERPYKDELDYEVPAGCFFIIKTKHFIEANYFDERTFLYNEELILGVKLKKLGYKFLFCPQEMIEHEGGKSIGANARKLSWFSTVCEKKSSVLSWL